MAARPGFGDFIRRMKIRGRQVEENAGRAVRAAALAADQGVVLATPTDKGRARSNWHVSIGTPVATNLEPPVEGDGEAAAQKALAQAAPVIGAWKPGLGPIYITNGVPYIIPLEEGSSRQAPQGMISQGIAAARIAVRRIRLLGRGRRAG